jgi:RNA polymerase II subunit A small phosphatase-like protein
MTEMTFEDRTLLILDVDETLIFSAERPLEREPDFRLGPYFVYRRPYLEEFLRTCAQHFQLALWTSASAAYLEAVVEAAWPSELSTTFAWSRNRCVQRFDPERFDFYFVKDLKKVKRKGFDLRRVLIVEDTPQKVERNYGNAVYLRPFFGDANDQELVLLSQYLLSIRNAEDVRSIEKRGWRTREHRET